MDLNSAEQWLAESETKMPKPTELQTQFILAGIVERQREEAAQREKQARKENLITILSHELQTPIAAMNAGISLIKRELQKNKYDRIEGFIDQVSDSIIKMQNLIEDTLHVTQLDKERGELDLGWVCLQDLISDILARRRKQIQYMDTQISTDMPNDPVQIYTDSSELAAVLTSLIVNGIHRALNDYKGSVSAVTVSIEAKNPTTVAIHVQDTGKNIPEDEIASVFEPFSTADLSTSRMKLYVAKQVTQKLGGTINVKSDIGKATSFSIVLPVQQDV
jgi:signal transduction histidine kinase